MSEIENLAWEIYRNEPAGENLREFYLRYLDKAKRFGKFDFLIANFKNFDLDNNIGLMLLLPELWMNFETGDWIALIKNMGDRPLKIKSEQYDTGIFTDIVFLCKYLEIDALDLSLNHSDLSSVNKLAILNYSRIFCDNFTKNPPEIESLNGADEKELGYQPYGCTLEELTEIKNRLLNDSRIKAFPQNKTLIRDYVEKIHSNFQRLQPAI